MYKSQFTGQEIEDRIASVSDKLNKQDVLELIYPVGSIYLSVNFVNPSIAFGFGTWEQIEDCFLLGAGAKYEGGVSGGQSEITLTEENLPEHTHTRGTMNITGWLTERPVMGNTVEVLRGNGAFTTQIYTDLVTDDEYPDWKRPLATDSSTTSTHSNNMHFFDASKTWKGETSAVGNGESFNNMPPYITVYIWKRIK